MKMKQEHYETLRDCMLSARKTRSEVDQVLTSMEIETEIYSNKRIRWDWLHLTKIDGYRGTVWICKHLYPYLNDDHIDTALRRITGLK